MDSVFLKKRFSFYRLILVIHVLFYRYLNRTLSAGILFVTGFVFMTSQLACTKKNSQSESQNIRIGEVGSFTGDTAAFGIATHRGIELAINEVNKKGGVLGKKIEIIKIDNQGREEEAATATTRLIHNEKVVAILGEVASKRSKAMAPIAQQNKIPMVSPSSTNPEVTAIGDFIFRVCFIDPFQGEVMARFAFDQMKFKKVAILRDIGEDYSVGLANSFIETFKSKGGEILADLSYTGKDIDFKAQLTAIKRLGPEAIFVPGYYTQVGLIARQVKELGLEIPLMGGDGWDAPELSKIGGKAIEGSYFSNHYSPDDSSQEVQGFIKQYKMVYNETPTGLAAQGYDAAMVLVRAIEKAGSVDSKLIRDALASTQDFQGVTGKITIDVNRNASKKAVVLKVESGGIFKYVTSILP